MGVESMATEIGGLIMRSPEIRGGRPRITGTGITVARVVSWFQLGLSPDEIAARIGHLSLAQVHAALAYYYLNSQEIDADLAAEDAAYDTLEAEYRRSRAAE
jgi:uncharacterized protein (DUF433 family)